MLFDWRDLLKGLPIGVGLPIVIGAASVGPEDAQSNISKWIEFLGIHDMPSWVAHRATDHYTIATAIVLAFAYSLAVWVFVPWYRARRVANEAARLTAGMEAGGLGDEWEPTHPYDMPIKLRMIDEAIEFLRTDYHPFAERAWDVFRNWDSYIEENKVEVLEAAVRMILERMCRLDHETERKRTENIKYDDLTDILAQDYILEYLESLDSFLKALTEHRPDKDKDALKERLRPRAERLERFMVLTKAWAESVVNTLLLRRRWLVREATGHSVNDTSMSAMYPRSFSN